MEETTLLKLDKVEICRDENVTFTKPPLRSTTENLCM